MWKRCRARCACRPGSSRGQTRGQPARTSRAGALALPAGRRLQPQDVALAAALGAPALDVRQRLRVALFSTGDELVDPGGQPGPAQRFDSNRILLAALCRRVGAAVTDLGILPDRQDAIAAALASAAAGHDAILTTGGVSAGEEDHVRAAVEATGRLVFWRVAIKPGRPVTMGEIGGAAFMGLPGNPVAGFVTFVHLARPMLAALAGEIYQPPHRLAVPAAFSYRKKAGRREYVRVRLENGRAYKHGVEGAGILTSLTQADGLAELADDVTGVTLGDPVGFLPFASLF